MTSNLNNLTIPELKNLVRTRRIGGISRLRKHELVFLLQQSSDTKQKIVQ